MPFGRHYGTVIVGFWTMTGPVYVGEKPGGNDDSKVSRPTAARYLGLSQT